MSLLALPLSTSGRLTWSSSWQFNSASRLARGKRGEGKPDPLWILILFFSLYDAMHEHRYDFFCQAVNRLRSLKSRQAVDIKHGEAVTSDQAPIAAISRAAGSFWGILNVLSSLPRFIPLDTQLLRK